MQQSQSEQLLPVRYQRAKNQTVISEMQEQKQGAFPARSSPGGGRLANQPSSLTHPSALTLTPLQEPAQPPRAPAALLPAKRCVNSTRGLITFYWTTRPRTWVGHSSTTPGTIKASLSLLSGCPSHPPDPHREVFMFLYWECFQFNLCLSELSSSMQSVTRPHATETQCQAVQSQAQISGRQHVMRTAGHPRHLHVGDRHCFHLTKSPLRLCTARPELLHWAYFRYCVCLRAQSCPTLCDPMDCSRPGSSVLGDKH